MKAFDNTNLVNIGASTHVPGFTPAITYAYDATAHTITVTDNSTKPSTFALEIIHVNVSDKNGKETYQGIATHHGNVVIDVSAMDPFEGFNVQAGYVSDVVDGSQLKANMAIYNVGYGTPVSGNLRYTNKQNC